MAELSSTTTIVDRAVTNSIFNLNIPEGRIDAAIENPDALKIAYDVGVLEITSIALGVVGVGLTALSIVLAIAAFCGFWLVRNAAMKAAQLEARKWLDQEGERLIQQKVRQEGLSSEAEKPDIEMSPEDIEGVLEKAEEIDEDMKS
ncbi:MAG: hypothetical protein RIB57_13720 [Pelagibacterium sp.]|uniref:hypothetical protein n=1 Tax=Pelagibacterium sp. TaxID=1967288 RepID=UPI0032EE480A